MIRETVVTRSERNIYNSIYIFDIYIINMI